MTFVDTSAWFALYVSGDPNYLAATQWLADNSDPLVTTDYVIDETLTLLRSRGRRGIAIQFGLDAFAKLFSDIEFLETQDIEEAWYVFQNFDDKDWSFTDCTSKLVMEKLYIDTAFAFDHHFRQFGTVVVVP